MKRRVNHISVEGGGTAPQEIHFCIECPLQDGLNLRFDLTICLPFQPLYLGHVGLFREFRKELDLTLVLTLHLRHDTLYVNDITLGYSRSTKIRDVVVERSLASLAGLTKALSEVPAFASPKSSD